jgi:hypothetical protein
MGNVIGKFVVGTVLFFGRTRVRKNEIARLTFVELEVELATRMILYHQMLFKLISTA